jgi:hypothetical protein
MEKGGWAGARVGKEQVNVSTQNAGSEQVTERSKQL